jgi:hypothetical protein
MLDFVISKVAMIVAAVFILLAGIGLYQIQKDAMEDEELHNIADKIAKSVNELGALNAETKLNFTFDKYADGIYIQSTVGDDYYELRFTRDILFIRQGGRTISSNFIDSVHLWKPDKIKYSTEEMVTLDGANTDLKISSEDNILIFAERKQIDRGVLEFNTFIYTG